MVRELEIKRGTFVDLSQRLSQLETERRILEPSTQLVNLAELPTRPAFPQQAAVPGRRADIGHGARDGGRPDLPTGP